MESIREYRTFPIKWEFDKMGIWAPENLQSSSRWNGNSIKWEGCSAFCSKLEIYTKFRNSKFQNLKMSKMLSSWILLKLTLYGGYPSEQLSSNLQRLGSSQSWCSRLHFFSTVVDHRNLWLNFQNFKSWIFKSEQVFFQIREHLGQMCGKWASQKSLQFDSR